MMHAWIVPLALTAILTGCGGGKATCSDLKSALLVHYTFDTDFSDSSGNHYDGSPTSVTIVPGGHLGGAASFAAGNSIVAVKGQGALRARAVCAWMNPGSTSGLGLPVVTGGSSGAGDLYGINADKNPSGDCAVFGNSRLYVDNWGTPCVTNAALAPVLPNEWSYVCWTDDFAGRLGFAVNGISYSQSWSPTTYAFDLGTVRVGGNQIGGTTTQNAFIGLLDDVAIWSAPLSDSELSAAYNGGQGCSF